MHDEPPDADAPVPGGPGDLTQRHPTVPADAGDVRETGGSGDPSEIAATATPGDSSMATSAGPTAPSDRATWAATEPVDPYGAPPASYTPSPEPRADWARSWSETAPVTPERWYEPAATPPPTEAVVPPRRSDRRGGSLVVASILSAVLASVGTVAALTAAGALDRPAPASASVPQATSVGTVQPVAIDESSATIAVASKVSPAVVRITVTGTTNAGNNGVIPETGVGSGVIFDSNGWILTNHHVVEGADSLTVQMNDGKSYPATVYGIDTLTDLAIVKNDVTGLPTAAL
ncbi:MAG: trypsin-like peptidase domain-containing protein, partial [Chloroflexota bacterium]